MRYSVLAGEGFWKWRLHDFFLNQNQFITQNLISKIVQWTASNTDQSRFRIYPMKKRFNETEAILFEAEIYNESFELIQNQDITIKILEIIFTILRSSKSSFLSKRLRYFLINRLSRFLNRINRFRPLSLKYYLDPLKTEKNIFWTFKSLVIITSKRFDFCNHFDRSKAEFMGYCRSL
jgi:hypothetical protein